MAAKLSPERIEQRKRNLEAARMAFRKIDGQIINGFPLIDSEVYHTKNGTPYLKKPGVVLISKPNTQIEGMRGFLKGFGENLSFEQYVDDPQKLDNGAQLIKVAGQVCYASFSKGRTWNIDADNYIEDIKKQEHGSVLEHPNYSFLIYGVSRSWSHEEVRHRAGKAFSQLSQRYVSGRVLRFVERQEYQNVPELHERFERGIEYANQEYNERAKILFNLQLRKQSKILSAEAKTDLKKKVQQAARSVLPNETETVLIDSGNGRAYQHTLNMRSGEHAETDMKELYFRLFLCVAMVEPLMFADFEIKEYPDGTRGAQSIYKKP